MTRIQTVFFNRILGSRILWLGILMSFLLTGCGFHLRGTIAVPAWLNNVAIEVKEAHQDLATIIKTEIQSYGRCVREDPSLAHYLLILECDNYKEQITNVSASTAPRQYLLTYELKFSLIEVNGTPIMADRMVAVTRQVTINNNRILGSNAEEALLKNEMRREAAIQLVNQLNQATGLA